MNKNKSAKIITLPEAYEVAYNVSRQITDSSQRFDLIVGISRGGLPPARMISDFLNIKTITSLQIRHYASGGEARENVEIIDPIRLELKGKKVLIVDDVNDSGKTLKAAREHVAALGPGLVKTAVLHEKENTSFNADYTGPALSEWRWLIYQWAVTEDLLEFLNRDRMLEAETGAALRHLNEKYDLEVDPELFGKLISLKTNYFPDQD